MRGKGLRRVVALFPQARMNFIPLLWMDEILHHFETMGIPPFLGISRGIIIPGFLGGARFRPSTVAWQVWENSRASVRCYVRGREMLARKLQHLEFCILSCVRWCVLSQPAKRMIYKSFLACSLPARSHGIAAPGSCCSCRSQDTGLGCKSFLAPFPGRPGLPVCN